MASSVVHLTAKDGIGQLSETFVDALDGQHHCDVVLIPRETEPIKSHQCVLASSPLLRDIFESDHVKHQPVVTVMLAEFHRESVFSLLQFLYTGEVELRKGTRNLVEFQELCRILGVNPPVKKLRNYGEQNQDVPKSKCRYCTEKFEASKLVFHRRVCGMVFGSYPSTTESDGLEDKSTEENTTMGSDQDKGKPKKDKQGERDCEFRMPDNFDLPEDFMNKKFDTDKTSTPKKSYAHLSSEATKTTLKKAKPFPLLTGAIANNKVDNKESSEKSNNKLSVSHYLAAKRKRMMEKLRADPPMEKETSSKKRKIPPPNADIKKKMQKRRHKLEHLEKVKRDKNHKCGSECPDDSDDDEYEEDEQWEPDNSSDSDREVNKRPRAKRMKELAKSFDYSDTSDDDAEEEEEEECDLSTSKNRRRLPLKNRKQIRVNVQLDAEADIIELTQYRLKFINSGSSSSEEGEEQEDIKPTKRQLKRVGKRISKLQSSDSSDNEHEDVPKAKKPSNEPRATTSTQATNDVKMAKVASVGETVQKHPVKATKPVSKSASVETGKKTVLDVPIQYNYGLTSENKLLAEKRANEPHETIMKMSFKKKPSCPSEKP